MEAASSAIHMECYAKPTNIISLIIIIILSTVSGAGNDDDEGWRTSFYYTMSFIECQLDN